jgi:two-component system response regulator ResD
VVWKEVITKTKLIGIFLLVFLMKRPNMVFTREQLLNEVWGYEFFGDLRTVDTHIKNLREKLKDARKQIVTIWGVGYKFEVKDK